MGLPYWQDPEEKSATKTVAKSVDRTAAARSSIRRRPSVHSLRHASWRHGRYFMTPPGSRSPDASHTSRRQSEVRDVLSIPNLIEPNASHTTHTFSSLPPPISPNLASPRTNENAPRSLRTRIDELWQRLEARRLASGHTGGEDRLQENRNRPDFSQTSQTTLWNFGTDLSRVQRSPRPQQNTLLTPPHDVSGDDGDLESSHNGSRSVGRRSHPLSNSWRPDSPVDGLGDRDRSPTPTDGWEIMRSTITPDENLPSVHSSFASTAASRSFANTNSASPTESDSQGDGPVGVTAEYLACLEDVASGSDSTGALADRMYVYEENNAPGGPRRIAQLRLLRANEGNRFALAHEAEHLDIGFRLIERYLETAEGRMTLAQLGIIPSNTAESEQFFSTARSRTRVSSNTTTDPSTAAVTTEQLRPRPSLRIQRIRAGTQDRHRERDRDLSRGPAGVFRSDMETPPSNPTIDPTQLARPLVPSNSSIHQVSSSREAQRGATEPRETSQSGSAGAFDLSDEERVQVEEQLQIVRREWPRLQRGEEMEDGWWAQIGLLLFRAYGFDPTTTDDVLSHLP